MSTKIEKYVKDHVHLYSYHKIKPESSWRGSFFIDFLSWLTAAYQILNPIKILICSKIVLLCKIKSDMQLHLRNNVYLYIFTPLYKNIWSQKAVDQSESAVPENHV